MRVRPRYRPRPRFSPPPAHRSGFGGIVSAIERVIRIIWLPALIFLLPVLYFWPALHAGFVSDDYFYHAQFTYTLRDFIEKLALIHEGEIRYPFFRPIGVISFKLDYYLWGADPVGFHLTNIILHSLNGVMLFYLARTVGINRIGSTVAALIFSMWPSHPEAVTWISGRFDVLSHTWLLVTLLLWSAGRLRGDVRWLAGSAAAFFIAIMSKESAAAGLLLLPIIDWLLHLHTRREHGQGVGFQWKWYMVFFAVVVCVVGFRIWLYGDIGGYHSPTGRTEFFGTDFGTVMNNLFVEDLWILITPINRLLWADWEPALRNALIATGIAGGIALIVATVWAVRQTVRVDETTLVRIGAGLLWIMVLLLPAAMIDGVADTLQRSRYLYGSVAGLALVAGVAASLGWKSGRLWRTLTVVVALAMILLSGSVLRRHNQPWLEAGEVASRLNAVMVTHSEGLPDRSTLFLVNFPFIRKGAHCAPGYYEYYLEYRFGIKGAVTMDKPIDPEDVDGWWENLRTGWRRPSVGFEWNLETETIRVLPPIILETEISEETEEQLGPEVPPPIPGETSEVEVFPEIPE